MCGGSDDVVRVCINDEYSDEDAAVMIKASADLFGSVDVLWAGWWFRFISEDSEEEILKRIKADGAWDE